MRNLAAHDVVKVALQSRHIAAQALKIIKRYLAYVSVFERNGIARMLGGSNRIHTQELTQHVKPRDLLASVVVKYGASHKSSAYRINRSRR